MLAFRCPSCDEATIGWRRKWSATSFAPAHCPVCRAPVYPSSGAASMWRTIEALLVTLIVVRALIGFSWWLVVVALLVIAAMETLRLYLVPLVVLRRQGGA